MTYFPIVHVIWLSKNISNAVATYPCLVTANNWPAQHNTSAINSHTHDTRFPLIDHGGSVNKGIWWSEIKKRHMDILSVQPSRKKQRNELEGVNVATN